MFLCFKQNPEIIADNIRELVNRFEDDELNLKTYLPAILKRAPSLASQRPDTVEHNIRDFVDRFSDEGLTVKKYLNAMVQPSPIMAPEALTVPSTTLEHNIRETVRRFSNEELTVEQYLNAIVKTRPIIIIYQPNKVENNVRKLIERFQEEGLDSKEYVQSIVKGRPQLFVQKPDTIEHNIRGLVEKFKDDGLTIKTYLNIALKNPMLFSLTPERVAPKMEFLMGCSELGLLDTKGKPFFEYLENKANLLTISKENLISRALVKDISSYEGNTFNGNKGQNTDRLINGFTVKNKDYDGLKSSGRGEKVDHLGRTAYQRLIEKGVVTSAELEKAGIEVGTWSSRAERIRTRQQASNHER